MYLGNMYSNYPISSQVNIQPHTIDMIAGMKAINWNGSKFQDCIRPCMPGDNQAHAEESKIANGEHLTVHCQIVVMC